MVLHFILFALAATKDDEVDPHLSKKIKAGNHHAFQCFYDAHYDGLLRFLISKNVSTENAKDLIQKAFIYIWENRQKIDPDKSLKAYIFKIAYTRMLNHHRDAKKFDADTGVHEQYDTLTPEDAVQLTELELAIEKAIEAMPQKRGMVFQLCFIEEFSYKEAAETLDLSRKTVENHMGYALKDIRKALQVFR